MGTSSWLFMCHLRFSCRNPMRPQPGENTESTIVFKLINWFIIYLRNLNINPFYWYTSSQTQGQIVGARESLNGQKNKARRKVKNGQKSPRGQCLTRPVSSKRSPPFWLLIGARKTQVFWHQSEARTAATVWNWSGKTLSPGALLAFTLVPYFSACLDIPSPPLSSPGSLRMTDISYFQI